MLLLALLPPAAWAGLTPPLEGWKQQIEERGGGSLVVVRVATDREHNQISLPEDTPFRDVLKRYFLDPGFVSQFIRTHALNLNYIGREGRLHFVLVNLALAKEWEDFEEAVLAHEFGHIWLSVAGYPAANLRGRSPDCIATQATDIVQHILIRRELASRGIDYRGYWIRNLDSALSHLRQEQNAIGQRSSCQTLAQVTLWLDVALGLEPTEWAGRPEFLEKMFARFPEIETAARSLETLLRGVPLEEPGAYRDALLRTYSILSAQSFTPPVKPR
jgi:hypothetical protein